MTGIDVLLITALKEEHDAARDVAISAAGNEFGVAEWEERDVTTSTPYLLGKYVAQGDRIINVALTRSTRMGGTATSPVASSLVERLKPRCLAMCGVCAGNPAYVALGDVIIAELVYAYDEGKQNQFSFECDHRQIQLSDIWLRAAQNMHPNNLESYGTASDEESKGWVLERLYVGDDPLKHLARKRYLPGKTWREKVIELEGNDFVRREGKTLFLTEKGRSFFERKSFYNPDGPTKLPFQIHVGPIASGNVVVKDGVTWENLKKWGVRSVLGLDMEAAAIGSAAHRLGVPSWVIIKGVVDHADPRKDDRYRPFAARVSAEVLFKFLLKQVAGTNPEVNQETQHEQHKVVPLAIGALNQAFAAPADGVPRSNHRDIEGDVAFKETMKCLATRMVELCEKKDRQDEINLPKLNADLEEAENELATIEAKLNQSAKLPDPTRKNFAQRAERLTKRIRQLRSEQESLYGRRTVSFETTAEQAYDAMVHDLGKTARWAEQINFLDSRRARTLDHIYVHLDIFFNPRRIRENSSEALPTVPFEQLLSHTPNHIVLLGQAGAGKTTCMKRLFLMVYKRLPNMASFYVAFVIRFRNLNSSQSQNESDNAGIIFGPLLRALKVKPDVSDKLRRDEYKGELREYQRMVVSSFLDALHAIVILDGFDELVGTFNREEVLKEIRELSISLTQARVVLTSRTGDFNYCIDRMDQLEIAPLDKVQIAKFANNWLGDPMRAAEFLVQVEASPFNDTMIRPLSLAHLCAIFERAGRVPNKPKTVYRKVVNLLLEEWDEQRPVERKSIYKSFTPDRKFDFLTSLAYVLTTKFETTTFDNDLLRRVYDDIHSDFDLPLREFNHVLSEIESHTSLFLKVGYGQFEFAHKSLQEFLTAEYIVRLPNMLRNPTELCRLPNEIAITIAISSQASEYLCNFVFNVLHRQQLPRDFYDVFMDRLVAEQPDFGLNSNAALALVILVSLWACRGGKSDAKSIPTAVPPTALERICRHFWDLFQGPGRKAVEMYYQIDSTANISKFVQMKRVYEPKAYRLPTRLFVPELLSEPLGLR